MSHHDLLTCYFGFTSNNERARKKQTSNSMKKLTSPSKIGTRLLFVQAKASRTGANLPTVAVTTKALASCCARFPVNCTEEVCSSQTAPSCRPTSNGNTLTVAAESSKPITGADWCRNIKPKGR